MKLYTIFYKNLNLYEGQLDGRYWLGGSSRQLNPLALIFKTKTDANKSLRHIKNQILTDVDYENSILREGIKEIRVSEFDIKPVIPF